MDYDKFRKDHCKMCGSQRCPSDNDAIDVCGYNENNLNQIQETNAIQIIGIDLSYSKDCSSISSICSGCKQIIETKLYDSKIYGCDFTVYKTCPHCGAKLVKHIIK